MTISDDLIKRAEAGEQDAQASIYQQLVQPIGLLIRRIVGRDDAEDVMQEAFIEILGKLNRFQYRSRFETWAYRVATNTALQQLRRSKRRMTVPLDEANTPSVAQTSTEMDREMIEKAMIGLSGEARALIHLREVQELSYADISAILNIPQGTVGSRLNTVRKELAARLRELGWGA